MGVKKLVGSNFNFKNKIINGDFSVWQRETSFSTSTANDIPYTADRWKIGYHPEDAEVRVEQAGVGLKFINNQTSNNSSIKQFIEPIMMYELLSNSGIYHYTLSYLMKNNDLEVDYSNLDSTAFRVEYTDGTSHQFPATVGLQGERQTWLIKIDTSNIDYSKTIRAFSIEIYLKPSTTSYLYDVQLEKGTIATEFEHVPFDVQLHRCRRYYFSTLYPHFRYDWLDGALTTNAISTVDFTERSYYLKNKMRTTPSITVYAFETGTVGKYRDRTDGVDAGTPAIGPETNTGERVYFYDHQGGLTNEHLYSWHFTADAEL